MTPMSADSPIVIANRYGSTDSRYRSNDACSAVTRPNAGRVWNALPPVTATAPATPLTRRLALRLAQPAQLLGSHGRVRSEPKRRHQGRGTEQQDSLGRTHILSLRAYSIFVRGR